MTTSKTGASAVAGIGHTRFSKASGKTVLALCAEACRAAISDAGLPRHEIDGLVSFTWDDNDELALLRALGLPGVRWTARAPFGGIGAYGVFQLAAAAIQAGAASNVLIFRAFNERSERRYGQPNANAKATELEQREFYRSFGLTTPAQAYALWCRAYLDRYGVTSEDLGRYVVQARAYAAGNPDAWFYRRPLTLEEHQASRWICEPVLRKLDCCQETDGAVAFVVSSAARARTLTKPVVRILAADQFFSAGSEVLYHYYRPDLAAQSDTELLAARLWAASGLSPREIDVMTAYDAFSPFVHMTLEGFGFCGPGEAKELINGGDIALDGAIPLNTHGGLLGEAYIHGMNNALEAVRQLRGEAANQKPGARTALVAGRHTGMVLARD
jgi:acetyl-CoA acetyltransferase